MIEAINLTKTYHDQKALDKLNLKVNAGEIFCLLGQNGAGKTTTINIFLGFTAPSSGHAMINEKEVKTGNAVTRRHIAYIPEIVMLYGHLTAIENLDFFSRLAGYTYSKEKLSALLNRAGLNQESHRKTLRLFSKGMRQKVGIAIALAKNAEVIFMDEPTSGLDPHATQEFTRIIRDLSAAGTTVFMATHDIFHAVNVGTRIGIMNRGTLVHTLDTSGLSADALQQLYLETI